MFCLMAVVAGPQECNVFAVFCQRLLTGRKRMGLLSLILVLLPFFASMLITNDVALITFVPFTIVVLSMIQRRQYLDLSHRPSDHRRQFGQHGRAGGKSPEPVPL